MKQKVFAFGCTICHKSFTQLKSLGEHVEKFHSNEKSEINDEKSQSLPISKEKKQKTLSPIKQSKQHQTCQRHQHVRETQGKYEKQKKQKQRLYRTK